MRHRLAISVGGYIRDLTTLKGNAGSLLGFEIFSKIFIAYKIRDKSHYVDTISHQLQRPISTFMNAHRTLTIIKTYSIIHLTGSKITINFIFIPGKENFSCI